MKNIRSTLALLVTATAALPRALRAQAKQPAHVIGTGGPIHTVDVPRPTAEAFATRGARVVFVATTRGAMMVTRPRTRALDPHGAAAYPGFIDAHAQLLAVGLA